MRPEITPRFRNSLVDRDCLVECLDSAADIVLGHQYNPKIIPGIHVIGVDLEHLSVDFDGPGKIVLNLQHNAEIKPSLSIFPRWHQYPPTHRINTFCILLL